MPDLRPNLLTVLRKTVARTKTRGPLEPLALVSNRIKETIRSSERLVILNRATAPHPDPGSTLMLKRARPEDARAYALFIGTDSASTFQARLDGDTDCYLVVERGRILHATWCTTTAAWTREIGAYLAPPPGDAYVYESFTRADARGKGVYPFALRALASDLHQRGVPRVWVAVEANNAPSLRAVSKAGFEEAGAIAFSRRWGRLKVDPGGLNPGESLHIDRRYHP